LSQQCAQILLIIEVASGGGHRPVVNQPSGIIVWSQAFLQFVNLMFVSCA
jgi:hypothetical protein